MPKEKSNIKVNVYIRNLGEYVSLLMITTLLFYYFRTFWNWNIDVPVSFSGDTISDGGALTLAQKVIKGEGILSTSGFWTIDNSQVSWGIMDGSLHYVLMRFLALFVHEAGRLMNLYYILTFGLCACFMFYVLKRLEIDSLISYIVSIIYAFLPGHWLRGVAHLAIGSCFALPLMILGCFFIISNSISIINNKENRLFIGNLTINRWLIEGIIGSLLVGFSSIYFCVFSMICHFFVLLISLLQNRKRFKFGICFLGSDLIAAFFTVLLPNILSNGAAIGSFSTTRSASNISYYSMKIAQLVLPIAGHRIPFMSELRMSYSTIFAENENATSSLGLFLTIGLILAVICVFKDTLKCKEFDDIKQIGKLIILILFVSVVGGVCEVIGIVFSSIRCYNRMSFIIACLSAIVMGKVLSLILKDKKNLWKYSICIIVLVVSLLDETTVGMKIDKVYAEAYEDAWNVEQQFFDLLMGKDNVENVIIYPSRFSSLYKEQYGIKYETMKSYIHTKNIKFATGYIEASATDKWLRSLEKFNDSEKIKICAGVGLDGILLYKDGFITEEVFQATYENFLSILGVENLIVSSDGQWYYFSLIEEKLKLKNSGLDLEQIYEKSINITANIMELNKEYAFGTDEIEPYIEEGFSVAETYRRWSLGDKSSMSYIINEKEFGDIDVKLKYLLLNRPQSIDIYISGEQIINIDVEEAPGVLEFTIPRELIKNGKVLMEIYYSNADSLYNLGINNDKRELAVAWESIQIIDTGNNVCENKNYIDMSFLQSN